MSVRSVVAARSRARLLPWIHTRFALIAGSLGALVILGSPERRMPRARRSRS